MVRIIADHTWGGVFRFIRATILHDRIRGLHDRDKRCHTALRFDSHVVRGILRRL